MPRRRTCALGAVVRGLLKSSGMLADVWALRRVGSGCAGGCKIMPRITRGAACGSSPWDVFSAGVPSPYRGRYARRC